MEDQSLLCPWEAVTAMHFFKLGFRTIKLVDVIFNLAKLLRSHTGEGKRLQGVS